MSTQPSYASFSRNAFRTFASAPWHFILLQTPAIVPDVLGEWMGPILEHHPPTRMFPLLVGYLALVLMVSTLNTATTLISVLCVNDGRAPQISHSVRQALERVGLLCVAAWTTGLVWTLGILALVIPGIYWMAVYLFVPHLIIMTRERLPVLVYLTRSKKLVRPYLMKTLGVGVVVVALFAAAYFVNLSLQTALEGTIRSSDYLGTVLVGVRVFVNMCLAAVIDVWISHYFLELYGRGVEV